MINYRVTQDKAAAATEMQSCVGDDLYGFYSPKIL